MEELLLLLIIVFLIVFLVIGTKTAKRQEEIDFNKGICPRCKTRLKRFDTDSQGGHGYQCEKCNYTTWVNYGADKRAVYPFNLYDKLRPHIGHNVVCVCYGKDGEDPRDICIECEDCCEVLVSTEIYEEE